MKKQLVDFLITVFGIAIGIVIMDYLDPEDDRDKWQGEAIKAGVAEYKLGEKRERIFVWKTNRVEASK